MIFSRFFLFKGNVNVISKNLPNSLHWYLDLQRKRKKIVFILFCKDFSLSVLYKSANPQEDLRISLISPRYPVVTGDQLHTFYQYQNNLYNEIIFIW